MCIKWPSGDAQGFVLCRANIKVRHDHAFDSGTLCSFSLGQGKACVLFLSRRRYTIVVDFLLGFNGPDLIHSAN